MGRGAGKRIYILSYAYWDMYRLHYLAHERDFTHEEFEHLCDSAFAEAVERVLGRAKEDEEIYLAEAVEEAARVLRERHGFKEVKPPEICYDGEFHLDECVSVLPPKLVRRVREHNRRAEKIRRKRWDERREAEWAERRKLVSGEELSRLFLEAEKACDGARSELRAGNLRAAAELAWKAASLSTRAVLLAWTGSADLFDLEAVDERLCRWYRELEGLEEWTKLPSERETKEAIRKAEGFVRAAKKLAEKARGAGGRRTAP